MVQYSIQGHGGKVGRRKEVAGKGRLGGFVGDFVQSFSGRQRRQYTFLFFRRISRSRCMMHISKDPSGPIRKNVTFIPFRIEGTVGLVTGHATVAAIAKMSERDKRGSEDLA